MSAEFLTSDMLSPIRHGFFTRRGGKSSGIYHGLNCGIGSSDQRSHVEHNREMAAQALGTTSEFLAGVYQFHSTDVHSVTAQTIPKQVHADALVTKQKGVALSVLSADCAPILFADTQAGVIGAAHSGWKGAIDGIATTTVEAMEAMGAKRENIKASVGPCISQKSYEVGPEFFERFSNQDKEFTRFFINGKEDRMLFDLPGFCLHQIRTAGVRDAHWIGHCTYLNESRFFSYRRKTHRKEADYGRMLSAIIL